MDDYVIVNRSQPTYLSGKISFLDYAKALAWCQTNPNRPLPTWFKEGLSTVGYDPGNRLTKDVILFRQPTTHRFGQASFEATWTCNYNCPFCVLGRKTDKKVKMQRFLPTEDKLRIVELIAQSGALFMQLTGGEIFTMSDFEQVYRLAHELGLVINLSSNGTLLSRLPKIQDLLLELPPNRVTFSMYGATAQSYETTTATSGTFSGFIKSVQWLQEVGLRVRINRIITESNQHEKRNMQQFVTSLGIESFEYDELTPNLDASFVQITHGVPKKQSIAKPSFGGCDTGITFFTVNPLGMASACKIAREPHVVDLLKLGEAAFEILPTFNQKVLSPTGSCTSCDSKSCGMCAPKIALHGERIPCSI